MTGTGLGRVLAGALVGLVAACLLVGGLALAAFTLVAPDADGFMTTGTEELRTDGYAVTSGDLELRGESAAAWTTVEDGATVRIRARAIDGRDVFVGIGRRDEVERYLAGSAHAEAVSLAGEPDYERREGTGRPAPPAAQAFWVAAASGPGEQAATWDVEGGDWAVVVMNADASPVVAAEVDAALRTGALLPIGLGIVAAGAVAALVSRALRAGYLDQRSTEPWAAELAGARRRSPGLAA
jgi:hypothetical protein